MAKTLQNLIATAIIASTLCSPAYSGERLNKRYENIGNGIGHAVTESMGESVKGGLENGLGGLKSLSGLADLFGNTPTPKLSKEQRIELKRTAESYSFAYILKNINKNTSEEANILKAIVEDSQQYHNSLTPEQRKKFDEFWEKVDRKNLRNILIYSNKNAFAWRLMKSELDLAEMHILYQLETIYSSMNEAKNNNDNNSYKRLFDKYQSFNSLLKPEGIEEYISEKVK
jgi:hypothetical protein